MRTAKTAHTENKNFVVFSCLNFGLTSIEQITLNKRGFSQK